MVISDTVESTARAALRVAGAYPSRRVVYQSGATELSRAIEPTIARIGLTGSAIEGT